MNHQREFALLKYITAVWDKDVHDILHLKDGCFYLYVLDLLNHCKKDSTGVDTEEKRLLYVKDFLQDFYGYSVKLDDYLHFEIILSGSDYKLNQTKMELAKLAVVLLGIALLDKNRKLFMDSALLLPVELQGDVLAMLQSVVLPDSSEVILTSRIESVLQTGITANKRPSSLVLNILTNENFHVDYRQGTPKTPCSENAHLTNSGSKVRTPLQSRVDLLNDSYFDVNSSFKYLDFKTPPSPLVDFIQSPQVIQKGVLKQKDLELRKLQEQLSTETVLKEEAQVALQDSMSECASQAVEIANLRRRLQETLSESSSDLQELQMKYSEKEAEIVRFKKKVQDLRLNREILEKESHSQADVISKLHLEVKSLKAECNRHIDLLEVVAQLEAEARSRETELAEMRRSHSRHEEERMSYEHNLATAREMNEQLRYELEEFQAKQSGNISVGENMDVVIHIQMGELRTQLKEVCRDKDILEKQLESAKKEISHLKLQMERSSQQLWKMEETNNSLSRALTVELSKSEKMKNYLKRQQSKYKDVKLKLENLLKEKEYAGDMRPDAFSCASETRHENFEHDRLSKNPEEADKKSLPGLLPLRSSLETCSFKSAAENIPMNRESGARNSISGPAKQRRSGGTVIYFPLDPNGPIYPPPHPPSQSRRISGRFVPISQITSST